MGNASQPGPEKPSYFDPNLVNMQVYKSNMWRDYLEMVVSHTTEDLKTREYSGNKELKRLQKAAKSVLEKEKEVLDVTSFFTKN